MTPTPGEVAWGLWFCEGLFAAGKQDRALVNGLVQQMPSLLGSNDQSIQESAFQNLVLIRSHVPGYRELMLSALNSPYHTVRRLSLMNCGTFLKRGEIQPLISFCKDPHYMEVSMAGPFVFTLRDQGLVSIESLLGKTFAGGIISEAVEGRVVEWRDWSPFFAWWNRPLRKFCRALQGRNELAK